jgi:hypothetical protein
MLRFILILLAFYLLFRVIQGIVRALAAWQRQSFPRNADTTDRQARKESPEYRDVRDANFKDLPDDDSKES